MLKSKWMNTLVSHASFCMRLQFVHVGPGLTIYYSFVFSAGECGGDTTALLKPTRTMGYAPFPKVLWRQAMWWMHHLIGAVCAWKVQHPRC